MTDLDVVVVDDHQLLCDAVCMALTLQGVVTRAVRPDATAALVVEILSLAPRVVLLDLDLGVHGDATPLVAPLTAAGIRVVVVTGSTDRGRIATALEQGAIGFRSKSDGFDLLVSTAREALTSTGLLDVDVRMTLFDELRIVREREARVRAPFAQLTEREQAALRAMADGQSVRDIAERWVVSEATVRTHVRGVLAKLDVRSQLAAVGMALRTGWLRSDAGSATTL